MGKSRAIPQDPVLQHREQGFALAGVHDAEVIGQPGDAQEHGAEHQHHGDHGLARIPRRGLPEGRHPVGDGLHAREGRAAGRIGLHEHPDGEPARQGRRHHRVVFSRGHAAREVAPEAEPDDREHRDHEPVGRNGEHRPALLHPAQVHQRDEGHHGQGESHPVGIRPGKSAGDGRDAGGHAHCHRQHVVHQQGGARHLGRQLAQVLLGHDVGAAAAGVGEDGLPVADGEDRQQQHDPDRHGPRPGQHRRPEGRHGHVGPQGGHDFAGGVGHGGEGVGAEHRQGDGIADAGFVAFLAGEAAAQQEASDIGHGQGSWFSGPSARGRRGWLRVPPAWRAGAARGRGERPSRPRGRSSHS